MVNARLSGLVAGIFGLLFSPMSARAGDDIPGFTLSRAGDGTYSRVSFKTYFGDTAHWRETALHADGLAFFVVEGGEANATKWLTLHQWIFPRTQRLALTALPGELRYSLKDSSGREWVLQGTQMNRSAVSYVVESIGGQKQGSNAPGPTDRGVIGVDFPAGKAFVLLHNPTSYSGYANKQDPKFLNAKSTFVDRRGKKCGVQNKELFGEKTDNKPRTSGFLFDTDAELAEFLATKCKALDVEPIRTAQPPPPLRDRFSRPETR